MKTLKSTRLILLACFLLLLTFSCEKNYPTTTIENPAPTYGLVKAVFGFDASGVAATLAAGTPVVPAACKTASYLAGEGEMAIINMNASIFPSVTQNSLFELKAAVDVDNSGTFTAISNAGMANIFGGAVCVGVSKMYPLIAGKNYVFGAEYKVSVGPVSLTKSTGTATVLIVKQ